jgi:hypothetical protein
MVEWSPRLAVHLMVPPPGPDPGLLQLLQLHWPHSRVLMVAPPLEMGPNPRHWEQREVLTQNICEHYTKADVTKHRLVTWRDSSG